MGFYRLIFCNYAYEWAVNKHVIPFPQPQKGAKAGGLAIVYCGDVA